LLLQEVEEYEEYDEAELVDDEDEDPDFSPGDAEDEETGEGEEAGSSEGEISDTNAPYAEAEAAQPAGRSRRGKQQTQCQGSTACCT
jgi:hypothetical protein